MATKNNLLLLLCLTFTTSLFNAHPHYLESSQSNALLTAQDGETFKLFLNATPLGHQQNFGQLLGQAIAHNQQFAVLKVVGTSGGRSKIRLFFPGEDAKFQDFCKESTKIEYKWFQYYPPVPMTAQQTMMVPHYSYPQPIIPQTLVPYVYGMQNPNQLAMIPHSQNQLPVYVQAPPTVPVQNQVAPATQDQALNTHTKLFQDAAEKDTTFTPSKPSACQQGLSTKPVPKPRQKKVKYERPSRKELQDMIDAQIAERKAQEAKRLEEQQNLAFEQQRQAELLKQENERNKQEQTRFLETMLEQAEKGIAIEEKDIGRVRNLQQTNNPTVHAIIAHADNNFRNIWQSITALAKADQLKNFPLVDLKAQKLTLKNPNATKVQKKNASTKIFDLAKTLPQAAAKGIELLQEKHFPESQEEKYQTCKKTLEESEDASTECKDALAIIKEYKSEKAQKVFTSAQDTPQVQKLKRRIELQKNEEKRAEEKRAEEEKKREERIDAFNKQKEKNEQKKSRPKKTKEEEQEEQERKQQIAAEKAAAKQKHLQETKKKTQKTKNKTQESKTDERAIQKATQEVAREKTQRTKKRQLEVQAINKKIEAIDCITENVTDQVLKLSKKLNLNEMTPQVLILYLIALENKKEKPSPELLEKADAILKGPQYENQISETMRHSLYWLVSANTPNIHKAWSYLNDAEAENISEALYRKALFLVHKNENDLIHLEQAGIEKCDKLNPQCKCQFVHAEEYLKFYLEREKDIKCRNNARKGLITIYIENVCPHVNPIEEGRHDFIQQIIQALEKEGTSEQDKLFVEQAKTTIQGIKKVLEGTQLVIKQQEQLKIIDCATSLQNMIVNGIEKNSKSIEKKIARFKEQYLEKLLTSKDTQLKIPLLMYYHSKWCVERLKNKDASSQENEITSKLKELATELHTQNEHTGTIILADIEKKQCTKSGNEEHKNCGHTKALEIYNEFLQNNNSEIADKIRKLKIENLSETKAYTGDNVSNDELKDLSDDIVDTLLCVDKGKYAESFLPMLSYISFEQSELESFLGTIVEKLQKQENDALTQWVIQKAYDNNMLTILDKSNFFETLNLENAQFFVNKTIQELKQPETNNPIVFLPFIKKIVKILKNTHRKTLNVTEFQSIVNSKAKEHVNSLKEQESYAPLVDFEQSFPDKVPKEIKHFLKAREDLFSNDQTKKKEAQQRIIQMAQQPKPLALTLIAAAAGLQEKSPTQSLILFEKLRKLYPNFDRSKYANVEFSCSSTLAFATDCSSEDKEKYIKIIQDLVDSEALPYYKYFAQAVLEEIKGNKDNALIHLKEGSEDNCPYCLSRLAELCCLEENNQEKALDYALRYKHVTQLSTTIDPLLFLKAGQVLCDSGDNRCLELFERSQMSQVQLLTHILKNKFFSENSIIHKLIKLDCTQFTGTQKEKENLLNVITSLLEQIKTDGIVWKNSSEEEIAKSLLNKGCKLIGAQDALSEEQQEIIYNISDLILQDDETEEYEKTKNTHSHTPGFAEICYPGKSCQRLAKGVNLLKEKNKFKEKNTVKQFNHSLVIYLSTIEEALRERRLQDLSLDTFRAYYDILTLLKEKGRNTNCLESRLLYSLSSYLPSIQSSDIGTFLQAEGETLLSKIKGILEGPKHPMDVVIASIILKTRQNSFMLMIANKTNGYTAPFDLIGKALQCLKRPTDLSAFIKEKLINSLNELTVLLQDVGKTDFSVFNQHEKIALFSNQPIDPNADFNKKVLFLAYKEHLYPNNITPIEWEDFYRESMSSACYSADLKKALEQVPMVNIKNKIEKEWERAAYAIPLEVFNPEILTNSQTVHVQGNKEERDLKLAEINETLDSLIGNNSAVFKRIIDIEDLQKANNNYNPTVADADTILSGLFNKINFSYSPAAKIQNANKVGNLLMEYTASLALQAAKQGETDTVISCLEKTLNKEKLCIAPEDLLNFFETVKPYLLRDHNKCKSLGYYLCNYLETRNDDKYEEYLSRMHTLFPQIVKQINQSEYSINRLILINKEQIITRYNNKEIAARNAIAFLMISLQADYPETEKPKTKEFTKLFKSIWDAGLRFRDVKELIITKYRFVKHVEAALEAWKAIIEKHNTSTNDLSKELNDVNDSLNVLTRPIGMQSEKLLAAIIQSVHDGVATLNNNFEKFTSS